MVYKNERVYNAVPPLTIAGKSGGGGGACCLILCKDPGLFPAVGASAKGNAHAADRCFTTTTANTTRDAHQGQEALINEKLIIGVVSFSWVRPQQHGGAVLPEGSREGERESWDQVSELNTAAIVPHGREGDWGYATHCSPAEI